LRLAIAVQHAGPAHRSEAAADLDGHAGSLDERQRPVARDDRVKGLAIEPLHPEARPVVEHVGRGW
jgi:hypothetical protein